MARKRAVLYAGKDYVVGDHLSVRYLRRADGRIDLTLVITEETTIDDLRAAWYRIIEARNILYQHQGEDPRDARLVCLLRYLALKYNGLSYADIARDTNEDILANLCKGVVAERTGRDPYGYLRAACHHMLLMAMKVDDVLDWVDAGLDDIRSGRRPWILGEGPVTAHRVRDTLRYLERQIDTGNFVVKTLPKYRTADLEEVYRGDSCLREGLELMRNLKGFGSPA